MINFPSRTSFPLWAGRKPEHPVARIFGELDLRLHQTYEAAFQHISELAEMLGYVLKRVNAQELEVWGHDSDEHVLITYDDSQSPPQIVDIEVFEYIVYDLDTQHITDSGLKYRADRFLSLRAGLYQNEEAREQAEKAKDPDDSESLVVGKAMPHTGFEPVFWP